MLASARRPAQELARSVRPAKARGELAEAQFLARAMDTRPRGFQALRRQRPLRLRRRFQRAPRPRVDQICVGRGGGRRLSSSAPHLRNCTGNSQCVLIAATEINCLVACIVPEDAWFIISIEAVAARNHLFLPANSRPHRLARYREAWHLLMRSEWGSLNT